VDAKPSYSSGALTVAVLWLPFTHAKIEEKQQITEKYQFVFFDRPEDIP
jgi:hypothetical protein